MPPSAYSFSLLRSVRIEMPRMLAAWVRLPRQCFSVSRIRSRSTSATVRPTSARVTCSAAKRGVRHRRRGFRQIEAVAIRGDDRLRPISSPCAISTGAVNGVLEFADVAVPAVGDQHACARFGRDRPQRHAVGIGIFLGEVVRQREDVARPLAQRRHVQIDDVQAVERSSRNVPSRTASPRLRFEVAMMRMSTGTGLVPPTRSIIAFLQGAQQLGLQADVHLGDLVEQQRAAIGLLELADAPRDGAGEGALLVAEEFGFEQVVGDGGAVDRDERRLSLRAICCGRSAPSLPCRCRFRR